MFWLVNLCSTFYSLGVALYTCARMDLISVCEKVIQYASTYYNRQTINENHGYKSHNAKTLKSHFMKCTRPNLNIKPDNKLDSIIDDPMIGFSRIHQFGLCPCVFALQFQGLILQVQVSGLASRALASQAQLVTFSPRLPCDHTWQ